MNKSRELRLTEAKTYKLAKLYLNYECLWKTTNENYKNWGLRNQAYMDICKALNVKNLHWREVPKKIKNMRSSYYQEIKRIEMSVQGGASPDSAYTPKVSWFPILESIMKRIDQVDDSASNHNEVLTVKHVKEECIIDNENPSSIVLNFEDTIETGSDEMKQDESSSNELHDPLITGSDGEKITLNNSSTRKRTFKFINPKRKFDVRRKRFKALKDEENNIDGDLRQLITGLDNMVETLKHKLEPEDEFDVFGRYIAVTLRSLALETSLIARNELQKTLCSVQLNALKHNNTTVTRTSESNEAMPSDIEK